MRPNDLAHLLSAAAFLAFSTSIAFAQGGPLTPPRGAPAPTMRSLDQVEPRMPLVGGAPGVSIAASGQITISEPGSYYLTGDVQIDGNATGIVIATSGVTLDLMGFSIIAPPTGDAVVGIRVNGANVIIHNGHIVSTTTFDPPSATFVTSGFDEGVSAGAPNVRISNISVTGVRFAGIFIDGEAGLVENCSVFSSGWFGIRNRAGTVIGCIVQTTGATGIDAAVVANCRVTNALSDGIFAQIVSNSYAESSGTVGRGIFAITVENSVGTTTGSSGITATTVSNSRGRSTNSALGNHGIFAASGQVSGSRGEAWGGHGIWALSVSDSIGVTSGAHSISSSGIQADRVSNSHGSATNASGGRGISGSHSVTGSSGVSAGFQGIFSDTGTVSHSYGSSTGSSDNIWLASHGIQAQIVANSRGIATGSSGIFAERAVLNSFGLTSHTVRTGHGIASSGTVTNCYGMSNSSGGGEGITGIVVRGSYGYAVTGARHGISALIAESSYGVRQFPISGNFGLKANRASLSEGVNGEDILHRYNMP